MNVLSTRRALSLIVNLATCCVVKLVGVAGGRCGGHITTRHVSLMFSDLMSSGQCWVYISVNNLDPDPRLHWDAVSLIRQLPCPNQEQSPLCWLLLLIVVSNFDIGVHFFLLKLPTTGDKNCICTWNQMVVVTKIFIYMRFYGTLLTRLPIVEGTLQICVLIEGKETMIKRTHICNSISIDS